MTNMKKTKATNRRAQTPKPLMGGRNERYSEAMQGKRFGNAATPHKLATDYRRRPKHAGRGWE